MSFKQAQLKKHYCVNSNAAYNNISAAALQEVFGDEFTHVHEAVCNKIANNEIVTQALQLCNDLFAKHNVDAVCTSVDDLSPDNAYFITFNS